MDLNRNGKLLCDLRKAKGMTQKEVASKLGIQPKTVSKWETGHGFPDVSTISQLADILGVDEKTILSGSMQVNMAQTGNMKRTSFYVCPVCGSFMQGIGNCSVVCCSKQLEPLKAKTVNDEHLVSISEIENDYYIKFNHDMTKAHYIGFVAYVRMDRVLTIKLYPEQEAALRFPKTYGGKFYFYCNNHGLFEIKI